MSIDPLVNPRMNNFFISAVCSSTEEFIDKPLLDALESSSFFKSAKMAVANDFKFIPVLAKYSDVKSY